MGILTGIAGAGTLAQIGLWLLFGLIWGKVLSNPIILFSGHPLAQAAGFVALVQAILIVQPTHTAAQKRAGQWLHVILNLTAFSAFFAGVFIIEYNKFSSGGEHFKSVHGYLGVIASVVLLLHYLFGISIWAVPSLYGGYDEARALYKYHRWAGYTVLLLLVATILSAIETPYNHNVLKLKWWSTAVPIFLAAAAILSRAKKHKLGLAAPPAPIRQ